MNRSGDQQPGELVPIELVAQTFAIDVVVLERAVALGLVGRPGEPLRLHVAEFDRVAAIVRLHVVLGVELDMVHALLPD